MPTQNLYPNAAGDLTQFSTVEPSSINHFQAVDETSADDDTTDVKPSEAGILSLNTAEADNNVFLVAAKAIYEPAPMSPNAT